MTTTERRPLGAHQVVRLLPAGYAERLALAAADRDIPRIDALTDELVRRYPHLVSPRTELGRFAPITREVRNATAG